MFYSLLLLICNYIYWGHGGRAYKMKSTLFLASKKRIYRNSLSMSEHANVKIKVSYTCSDYACTEALAIRIPNQKKGERPN